MISVESLMAACQKISDAALVGDGWPDALEALAHAAGSRGVLIMHNRDQRLVSFVSDNSIREPVDYYLAGKAPPNARQTKVKHDNEPGFRIDFDDFQIGEIARDPYYQDYLRPLGLLWHANARLRMEGADEVAISFKRELKHGAYDDGAKSVLDRILPRLRSSVRIAEYVFDAETRGMVRALHQRGRPVLEFDAWARVRKQHGDFDGTTGPITVRLNRAITTEPAARARLEQAIEKAVRQPARQSLVPLTDLAGKRYLFQIVPVTGRSRDVFFATSAIGVLIERPALDHPAFDTELARAMFQFSFREAQVAGLLCEGRSTAEIAATLTVGLETVRFHLKSIFEKTGARGRVEVVALLARLAV